MADDSVVSGLRIRDLNVTNGNVIKANTDGKLIASKITVADISGISGDYIDGTGTETQIAYFTDTKDISGCSELTWDGKNLELYNHLPTNFTIFNNVQDAQGYAGYACVNTTSPTGGPTCGLAINPGTSQLSFIAEDESGYLYISDRNLGNIYVINPISFELVKTVASPVAGNYTDPIVYCPANKKLYIANDKNISTGVSNGTISILDTQTWEYTGSIVLADVSGDAGSDIAEMAFCPVNGYIYGTWQSTTNPYVFAIDPITDTEVVRINSSYPQPWGVTFCPYNEHLYIGRVLTPNDYIEVIDPLTNTIIDTIGPLEHPQHSIYCPETQLLYFVGSFYRKIHVIDPRNNEIIDEVDYSSDFRGVTRLQSIFWNPDKKLMYAVGYGTGSTSEGGIRIVEPETLRTLKQLKFGLSPANSRFSVYSRHTGVMFALNSNEGYVLKII